MTTRTDSDPGGAIGAGQLVSTCDGKPRSVQRRSERTNAHVQGPVGVPRWRLRDQQVRRHELGGQGLDRLAILGQEDVHARQEARPHHVDLLIALERPF